MQKKYIQTKRVKYRPNRDTKYVANKYRSELVKNQTSAERMFAYILDKLNVRYRVQFIIYPSKNFFIVDFFLQDHKIVFEIDGKQHYTQKGLEKDMKRDKCLSGLGLTVKRFRNNEVYNPRKCERRIKDILGIKTNKFF